MTLVVTEISKHGIVMAADSAITQKSFTDNQITVRTGMQKIIPIPYLKGAMGFWGDSSVLSTDLPKRPVSTLDRFLVDFVERHEDCKSIESFGQKLCDDLNSKIEIGKYRLGIQLTGYKNGDDNITPRIFHLHTGKENEPQNELRLHHDFICEKRPTVDSWKEALKSETFWLRNGDYERYAQFAKPLNELVTKWSEQDFCCPDSTKFKHKAKSLGRSENFAELEARGRFIKLQVEFMCDLHQLSNQPNFVSRPVSWIAISPEKIEIFEPVTSPLNSK